MMWPQLILIAIFVLNLGTMYAVSVISGLLYWGGFFDELIRRLSGH